ncbi:MAG: lipoprotein-releasing ABC transporter permease subunit [Alphaproteobacteria bacterium]|nr:lipoprotein-releasing ABC transporter permease subunit [Alphaproteobacteria bacterium]
MIFSVFERLVAKRYLKAKRKEGFISVITAFAFGGIALGVATLIIVMSVMNGFRHELLTRILGINGHITIISQAGYPFNNYQEAVDEISGIANVKTVIPTVDGQVLVSTKISSEGAMVRGINAEDINSKDILKESFSTVDLKAFHGDNVVIGSRMARKMGVMIGDNITIISPNGKISAFGMVPRMKAYKVVGYFELGMSEYDSSLIFMPLETAQTFFGMKEAVTNIDVTLKDTNLLYENKVAIQDAVGYSAHVYDWNQTNSAFFNALEVERNVMFLILTLIILVAAFNIITGLIMLVKDKGRDIAVLRTMGATKGMIMRIFFLDGAFIGVVGTLIGFVIGILFCENIDTIKGALETLSGTELFSAEVYFLSKLPAKIDYSEVIMVGVMALSISFLATLFPAYRAAKFDPVEALRYE